MNQGHLQSFICCADSKSFSAAAQKMYISTNSLLQQINLLEQEVGVALFVRSPRGIQLTDSGTLLYSGAKNLLQQWGQILIESRNAARKKDGIVIRLSIPKMGKTIFIARVCEEYAKIHNDVRYIFSPQSNRHPSDDVLQGTMEFAIIPYIPRLENQDVEFTFLYEAPIYCVMSRSHPLAKKKSIVSRDLDEYDVLVDNEDWIPVLPFLKNHKKCIEVVEDQSFVYSSCYAGSVYLLPDMYAKLFQPFATIPICDLPKVRMGVICRSDASEDIKAFIAFFANRVKVVFENPDISI